MCRLKPKCSVCQVIATSEPAKLTKLAEFLYGLWKMEIGKNFKGGLF